MSSVSSGESISSLSSVSSSENSKEGERLKNEPEYDKLIELKTALNSVLNETSAENVVEKEKEINLTQSVNDQKLKLSRDDVCSEKNSSSCSKSSKISDKTPVKSNSSSVKSCATSDNDSQLSEQNTSADIISIKSSEESENCDKVSVKHEQDPANLEEKVEDFDSQFVENYKKPQEEKVEVSLSQNNTVEIINDFVKSDSIPEKFSDKASSSSEDAISSPGNNLFSQEILAKHDKNSNPEIVVDSFMDVKQNKNVSNSFEKFHHEDTSISFVEDKYDIDKKNEVCNDEVASDSSDVSSNSSNEQPLQQYERTVVIVKQTFENKDVKNIQIEEVKTVETTNSKESEEQISDSVENVLKESFQENDEVAAFVNHQAFPDLDEKTKRSSSSSSSGDSSSMSSSDEGLLPGNDAALAHDTVCDNSVCNVIEHASAVVVNGTLENNLTEINEESSSLCETQNVPISDEDEERSRRSSNSSSSSCKSSSSSSRSSSSLELNEKVNTNALVEKAVDTGVVLPSINVSNFDENSEIFVEDESKYVSEDVSLMTDDGNFLDSVTLVGSVISSDEDTICAEDIKEFVVENSYNYSTTAEQKTEVIENYFETDLPVEEKSEFKANLSTSTPLKESGKEEVIEKNVPEEHDKNGAI